MTQTPAPAAFPVPVVHLVGFRFRNMTVDGQDWAYLAFRSDMAAQDFVWMMESAGVAETFTEAHPAPWLTTTTVFVLWNNDKGSHYIYPTKGMAEDAIDTGVGFDQHMFTVKITEGK